MFLRSIHRPRRRPLGIESLEGRAVPAGLVTAQLLLDGTLQILGDANNNKIEVSQDYHNIKVEGINTSVNGVAKASFDAKAVANIVIRLDGGNDTAKLKDLSIPGDITISDDDGKDNYQADGLYMSTSSLSINTGEGDDKVSVDWSILGGLFVNTGADDDKVEVEDSTISIADINTAGGKDYAKVSDAYIGTLSLNTGGGADYIDMEYVQAHNLLVNAGAGSDTVHARFVVASALGLVNGDGGTDLLDDDGGNLFVSTGFEGFI